MGTRQPGFQLSDKEWQRADEFMEMKRTDKYLGPIGGQFTMTTLGCIINVRDNVSKEVCDVTDYEMF